MKYIINIGDWNISQASRLIDHRISEMSPWYELWTLWKSKLQIRAKVSPCQVHSGIFAYCQKCTTICVAVLVPLLTLRTVRLIGAKTLKNHHGQKVALDQPKPHAFSLFRNAAQHEIQRSLPSRKSHSRLVCLDWIWFDPKHISWWPPPICVSAFLSSTSFERILPSKQYGSCSIVSKIDGVCPSHGTSHANNKNRRLSSTISKTKTKGVNLLGF